MRTDRIKQIACVIEHQPQNFDMTNFITVRGLTDLATDVPDPAEVLPCNTKMCVAGWAVCLFGSPEQRKTANRPPYPFQKIAMELLEMTMEEASVFYDHRLDLADDAVYFLRHMAKTNHYPFND